MLDSFCAENPTVWDQEINSFLFQFRTIVPYAGRVSPFNLMFARSPTGTYGWRGKVIVLVVVVDDSLDYLPWKLLYVFRLKTQGKKCAYHYIGIYFSSMEV